MSAPRILILDDEESLVAALVRHFERRGYEPTGAYLVAEATKAIEESVQTGRPFAASRLGAINTPSGANMVAT